MNLILIWKIRSNKDNKHLRSKFQYAVLEKLIFQNFWEYFYDDVIYRDDSHVWSNKEFKIKTEDLNLVFVTFWNFMAVKCALEKYSN